MNDALLQELLDAGTPPLLVAKVAAEIARASAANDILEQRRANERERKARARSREVTGQHVTARDSADTPLSLSPNENNSNPHTHTPVSKPRARKGWPVPDGVEAGQWEAFCRQRKKPLNDHAYQLLTGKLLSMARDGWPPGEMIDLAIERGWETVFAPKEFRNVERFRDPRNGRTPASGSSILERLDSDDFAAGIA